MFIEVEALPIARPGRIVTAVDADGEPGQLPDSVVITASYDGQIEQIPLTRAHALALLAQLSDALSAPLPE